MRELLGADASRVGAELKLADEQIERMRLIVTQLLQFARPTEFAGYVTHVDVPEVIEESFRLVGHLHSAANIRVDRQFTSDRTAAINRQELKQVLVNILANAIHAMPDGGTLELSTRDWDDDGIEISIADSGPGMSEELIAEVFEPFVTRKSGGTGLGLWISRSIVERYGGDIRASNRRGGARGAVFSVLLRGRLNLDGEPPDGQVSVIAMLLSAPASRPGGCLRPRCEWLSHPASVDARMYAKARETGSPLQAFCTFPRFLWCGRPLATQHENHHEDEEVDLCETEAERAHRGHDVEVGELHGVVGVAARHSRKPEKVHWEEGEIEEDHRAPKMNLASTSRT